MSKIVGIITDVKGFPTKTGKTMYSITVNGTRYGVGMKQVGEVGDHIEFDAEANGQYWNANNVVNNGKPPAPAVAPAASVVVASERSEDKMTKADWKKKDNIVSWQAARNSANDLIVGMLASGKLDAMAPKEPKNWPDVIVKLSDIYTEKFFESSQNLSTKKPKKVTEVDESGEEGEDE